MTQAGGPAAVNGFLYQIIHHLDWLASVRLTGELDGEEILDALLVLEPRSGGDARAEALGVYIVEQYKTREHGTWSLSDIVSVLCDLRKAVPSSLPASARYRFVTDGRAGKLDAFEAFLSNVKAANCPDDLDNDKTITFSKGRIATNREFFDLVNTAIQNCKSQSIVHEPAVTFHLLAHFKMDFCVTGHACAAKLESVLRQYAPDLGAESEIREHLTGVLLEELSKGEVYLDASGIDAIFKRVRLSPERKQKLATLPETMGEVTRRRLGHLKYQADRDVRHIPKWPDGKSVLLISGKSGVGKTWQLGRLLEASREQRNIVTLVQVARNHEDLLTQASRDLWQTGLGETSNKSLIAVSHFIRDLDPNLLTPGPIVALDDVQDIDLARDLVRQDWADWGMRLVLTVPDAVAQALSVTDSDTFHVHTVGDFTVPELDLLLHQKGHRWVDLPSDLKILLRRPILAGLFLDLPHSSVQRAPRSEYEIFDRFWKGIAANGKRGDEGIIIALAAHIAEGEPYPLLRPMWHQIGLSDEDTLVRIEATGWLRCSENGEVAFSHDRLLNWAVAKSLVQQFKRREISIDDLGAFEGQKMDGRPSIPLGYVPMDVLWLLAEDGQGSQTLGDLVRRWEDRSEFGNYSRSLYVDLLPTLGQHTVPILLERLHQIQAGSQGDYRVGLIGKAFAELAQQDHVNLDEAIESLLGTSSHDLQNVALAAITVAPMADHLDSLWELHMQRCNALVENTAAVRHTNYVSSFDALCAGIALDPGWLRDRILTADPEKDRVSELGHLLNALEHSDAPAIWYDTRDVLINKISRDKPRSLLHCIARFADRDKLDFVIQHLSSSKDFASSAALVALSVLDPPAAVDRLVEVGDAERYLSRNQWLPVLLHAQPDLTRRRILELAKAKPQERRLRFIVDLFWERPDDVDEAMFQFLLRTLENDLGKYLRRAFGEDQLWLYHPLDFLGRITRLELLDIYEAEQSGELETMIAAVACSRLSTNSDVLDHIRESARRVLILIGGEGITTLVNRELESEHFWVRHCGLIWAAVREDDGIVDRLTAIASQAVPPDADENMKYQYSRELYQSTTALAALGADSALVEVMETSGVAEVPNGLAQLRAHRGPLLKALTSRALQVLQSTDPSEDLLLTALAIAWLSGDTDLIPPVRTVLEKVEKEGRIAAYACTALQALGDSSDDFAHLASTLLGTRENSTVGLQALVSMGNQRSDLLATWLRSRPLPKSDDIDCQIIRALYDNPATRTLSVDAAVDRCDGRDVLLDNLYDIAAEATDDALRERILDKAFSARSFVTTQPLTAIKGLAKIDVIRAVEAIEIGFRLHPNIEQQLCHILVRIAPETAAKQLIDSVLSIERESFRGAVGRALRRLDSESVSSLVIEKMNGLVSERKVVAEIAGWLPTSVISHALRKLADHDSAIEVRIAALSALGRHRQDAIVRALLAAFPTGTTERRWSLLVAILGAGDPHLLTDCEDPLWLGNMLSDNVPAVFAHHANSVLRQRKQQKD